MPHAQPASPRILRAEKPAYPPAPNSYPLAEAPWCDQWSAATPPTATQPPGPASRVLTASR